jgi:D-3-phosphoglycerate dehydrogenase
VDVETIDALSPNARLVRYGVGYDNIDVAAARRRNVGVAYIPDYCTDEVADHGATALLTLLRKLTLLDASVRRNEWNTVAISRPMPAFRDSVVGFLGLGRIGEAVLRRLKPFGFRFAAYDPYLASDRAAALGVERYASLESFLPAVDALSLHAPSTRETRHCINDRSISLMKPSCVVVNTARGDLIDTVALANALGKGAIAAAALDVFESEPLPATSPLRTAPNCLLTPHSAWYSDSSITRLQELAADEIRRALTGEPIRQPVPA